jgi:hypothetical protein
MPHPRLCLFAAVIGLAGLTARAQLADSSPFLPAGVAGGTSTDASQLELRGILVGPEGTRYDIYDPVKKSGTWSGLNERGHDFTIRSADPDPAHGRIIVQAAGRTYPLTLKSAKAAAMGPGGPGIAAGPGVANGTSVTPADEAARLAAVAEEVRRRRQLRDQAAQGGGAPAPDGNAAQSGDQGQGRGRRRQDQ